MKQFLLITTFLVLTAPAIAQSLKITSVDVSSTRRYQEVAKKFLGKTMSLTFYDNSVKIMIGGKDETLVLSKFDESNYRFVDQSDYHRRSYRLKVNTTLMVVSSIEFTATFEDAVYGTGANSKPTGQWKFDDSFTVVAKRF